MAKLQAMDQAERSDADNKGVASEEEKKLETLIESMVALLGSIDNKYVQAYSISVVPDHLKEQNEDAYSPKVVSIGPRYRGTRKDLLYMEVIKLRCMLSLIHRTEDTRYIKENLKKCSRAILGLDQVIRACYVDDIKLDRYELTRVMLLDGCFLLELLITGSKELDDQLKSSYPGPGAEVGKMEEVLSDLTVFENQIPLVILTKLFRILFPHDFPGKDDNEVTNINKLVLSLSGYSWVSSLNSSTNPAHFLELVQSSIPGKGKNVEHKTKYLPNNGENQEIQHSSIDFRREGVVEDKFVELKLKRCATMLKAAGVTIKPPPGSELVQRLVNMQWNCFGRMMLRLMSKGAEWKHVSDPGPEVSRFDFDIKFSKGKLEIPPLHITKTTKAKWRNFIAWEHHKMKWKSANSTAGDQGRTVGLSSKCTSSALLFSGLICCASDVQLLKDRKVIVDHSKMSNEDLMTFFRTIAVGLDHGIVDSSYIKMCDDLNTYSSVNCVLQIHIIVWHYCRRFLEWLYKFLKRDYHFAATVILVLTVVQTVYAVLSYHLK